MAQFVDLNAFFSAIDIQSFSSIGGKLSAALLFQLLSCIV
jgi:hypothetical protein